jgi:8-oxo-dGTP pyrophosphatase MutT (NUDIX family)
MITFEKSSGVVVFRHTNKEIEYLLLQYRNKHWSFPKGHIEKNESVIDTALRETKEETGIDDLKIVANFKKNIYFYYKAIGQEKINRLREKRKIRIFKRVTFFLGESGKENIVLSDEQIDFAWLNFEDATKKVTYSKDRGVLMEANQYLKNTQD